MAGSWRVAARLARREVRRRRGRTALVVLLIAVPVAAMVVAAALYRAGETTAAEHWQFEHGQADAAQWGVNDPTTVDPATFPEGSRVLLVGSSVATLAAEAGGRCICDVIGLPLDDPLAEGIVRVTAGRAPRVGEVLLTSPAARKLGVDVGDTLRLEHPADVILQVVGLGQSRGYLDGSWAVVAPGEPAAAVFGAAPGESIHALVDLPDDLSGSELAALEDRSPLGLMLAPGIRGEPTTSINGGAEEAVAWTWAAGAVGLTVLGILIAGAFAAGGRRQLTTLGQLSACGAPPEVLRRTLFLQGTLCGIVGSAVGLGLATVTLAGLRSQVPRILNRDVHDYGLQLFDVLPVVPIAVLVATLAAMMPAFTASRVSVLTALAGRRPLGPVSPRLTRAGLTAVLAGLGMLGLATFGAFNLPDTRFATRGAIWQSVAAFGVVALLVGVCASAPAYVRILEPLADRTRGTWRLAARSLTRQRSRTGPVVAAIGVTAAVSVAGAAFALGSQQLLRAEQRYELPRNIVRLTSVRDTPTGPAPTAHQLTPSRVVDLVRREIPGAVAVELSGAFPAGTGGSASYVPRKFTLANSRWRPSDADRFWPVPEVARLADDLLLDTFAVDAADRRRLDDVGAVLIGPTAGRATIDVTTPGFGDGYDMSPSELVRPRARPPGTVTSFDVTVLDADAAGSLARIGGLLVTPEQARELDLVASPFEIVLRAPGAVTADQALAIYSTLDLANAQPDAPLDTRLFMSAQLNHGDGLYDRGLIESGIAAAALLFALFVVAANLALAAAETRDERDVLSIVGAAPRTMTRTNACKAILLTGLGAVLAVPLGWLPVAIHLALDGEGIPTVFPLRTVALLVIGVPLVAGGMTTVATRLSLRYRPVLLSTTTFE